MLENIERYQNILNDDLVVSQLLKINDRYHKREAKPPQTWPLIDFPK